MIMEWKSRTDAHQMTISSGEEEDDRDSGSLTVISPLKEGDQVRVGTNVISRS